MNLYKYLGWKLVFLMIMWFYYLALGFLFGDLTQLLLGDNWIAGIGGVLGAFMLAEIIVAAMMLCSDRDSIPLSYSDEKIKEVRRVVYWIFPIFLFGWHLPRVLLRVIRRFAHLPRAEAVV